MPKKTKGRAKQKAKANEARQQGGKARKFADNFAAKSVLARDASDDEAGNIGFRGFSLGSKGKSSRPQQAQPLRHTQVAFVSAGNQTPIVSIEEEEVNTPVTAPQEQDDVDMVDGPDELQANIDASGLHSDEHPNKMKDTDVDAMAQMSIESSAEVTALDTDTAPSDFDMQPQSDAQLFVVDMAGDPDVRMTKADGKRPAPAVRDPSPTPSNSSEEVVVFSGRNKAQPKSIEDPVGKREPVNQKEKVVQEPTISKRLKPHEKQALMDADRANNKANNQEKRNELVKDATNHPRTSRSPSKQRDSRSPDKDDLLGPLERSLRTSRTQAQTRPTAFPAGPMQEPVQALGLMPQQDVAEEPWAPAPSGKWWKGEGAPQNVEDLRKLDMESFVAPPFRTAEQGPSTGASKIADLQAEWKAALREKRATNPGNKIQSRKGKNNRKRQNRQLVNMGDDMSDVESAAAMADYVQNMKEQLNGDDSFEPSKFVERTSPAVDLDNLASGDGGDWVSDDSISILGDSDDSDASSPDERTREDVEDDLYSAHPEILERHIREMAEAQARDEYDYDSSDFERQLAREEKEDYEDAEDLRLRRIERMDDETIARMLAKQQELGIPGDELVIETGDYSSPTSDDDEYDGFGDIDEARSGLARLQALQAGKKSATKMPQKDRKGFFREVRQASKAANGEKKGKKNKDTDFAFPSASGLASFLESEEYGGIEDLGFDIMDFERPSLNPRKTTGRRGKLPQEIEDLLDEELQGELHRQWAKDKEKKKSVKAHREEQRMQGLLGTHGGPADLSAKYQSGITKPQLISELTLFLLDEGRTSCPLPPMQSSDRKAVHEAVAKIGLNSKSVGKQQARFTVVHKTGKTLINEEALLRAVRTTRGLKGFIKNNSYTGKTKSQHFDNKTGRTVRAKRQGGVGEAGMNREGAVVAQHAKELGKENKGHSMMEKMGWTSGTGLGAQRDGRVVPVEAMIKTTKSGLGQGSGKGSGGGGQSSAFGFMKGKSGMGGRTGVDDEWD
ncbi:hypothetical protein MBLNU230_g1346t1 [Neophaeotheca triangularis]